MHCPYATYSNPTNVKQWVSRQPVWVKHCNVVFCFHWVSLNFVLRVKSMFLIEGDRSYTEAMFPTHTAPLSPSALQSIYNRERVHDRRTRPIYSSTTFESTSTSFSLSISLRLAPCLQANSPFHHLSRYAAVLSSPLSLSLCIKAILHYLTPPRHRVETRRLRVSFWDPFPPHARQISFSVL